MIGFDFDYYLPGTVAEAVSLYAELAAAGQHPYYYSGGTEIISMARKNNVIPGAVIDIKALPECTVLEADGGALAIGAAVTLTRIAESGLFPLLGSAGSRVADHTIQGKVTLGGNVCGTIIYREAVLPLLLADATVLLAGPGGSKEEPLADRFDGRMRLEPGELLTGFRVDARYAAAPWHHSKQTKQDRIAYPVLTTTAMLVDGKLRLAFSGLCECPFRWGELEGRIAAAGMAGSAVVDAAIDAALPGLPWPVLDDVEGSAAYRRFVLAGAAREAASALLGVS